MYVTKALAAKMEACIKQTHIQVTQQYAQGKVLEISGGAACFSGVDSFFSQLIGWGFQTEVKDFKRDIYEIEEFYNLLNHTRIDIELCPFVGNHLINSLSQRGYRVTEVNNVSALDLNDYQMVDYFDDQLQIREVDSSEYGEWAKRIAIGFGYPEAQDQFYHYVSAKNVAAFAVFDQGQIVAGATIAMHGEACDLGVTSTLPIYRGKGLQKKLLHARLSLAKQFGLTLATVATEPGTVSDLNIQKSGFHCAYTRIKMTSDKF